MIAQVKVECSALLKVACPSVSRHTQDVCCRTTVPGGVYDAAVSPPARSGGIESLSTAAGTHASHGIHSLGNGATVGVLHQPCGCVGLPVSLPLHHDCPQLLLLHLLGKTGPLWKVGHSQLLTVFL